MPERVVRAFSISQAVLQEIDARKGDYSRSRYAERLLKIGLKGDKNAGN